MATTPIYNLYSLDGGDDYDLVIDTGVMASSVESALLLKDDRPIVSATLGGLPAGTYEGQSAWVTTPSPGTLYIWTGAAWALAAPEPPDTGLVDLGDYKASGSISGSVLGRIKQGWVSISTPIVTTSIPSQAAETPILVNLPEMWRPATAALGVARRSGYSGGVGVSVSGNLGVSNRTGTAWDAAAFFISYPSA